MKSFLKVTVVGVLALAALLPSRSQAQNAIFTFEEPQFTFGQTTPLLNQYPNAGDPNQLASFTDPANPNSYIVFPIASIGSAPGMDGQVLINLFGSGSLEIAFSKPITQFSVNYVLNVDGSFQASTTQGVFTSTGANQGGDFPTGTLLFSTALPFTSVTLSSIDVTGAESAFGIDNLQVGTSAVPEPGSIALLVAIGTTGAGFLARRKNAQKAA